MCNVFNQRSNRQEMKNLVASSKLNQLKLVLWEPNHTDDESDDYSEDESVDDPISEVDADKDEVDPSHCD